MASAVDTWKAREQPMVPCQKAASKSLQYKGKQPPTFFLLAICRLSTRQDKKHAQLFYRSLLGISLLGRNL
jgi:hypothetical protein